MGRALRGDVSRSRVETHPLDPQDAALMSGLRESSRAAKGTARGTEARPSFDALMERVEPRQDVLFEPDTVGGISGLWAMPAQPPRADEAILHLHGGWFSLGTAKAYRHLAGHLAARVGAKVFIPDYRLAPEHPFPAAPDDALACYRGLDARVQRIAITGDSAGGNLALGLASRIATAGFFGRAALVGVAAISPVTDLSLSSKTYRTRAEADPFFTRAQAKELVHAYLGKAEPRQPMASPLHALFSGLPAIRIDVGDDEVLLDDSRRYFERAIADGVDATLAVWLGMPHGFVTQVGAAKAANRALDAIAAFLIDKLRANAGGC